MRWTLRISFLLFLAWVIFMVSPFVALYDLAKAVEAKDVGRITERVNFNAVRTSLSRQILGEYFKDMNEAERDLATRAGTTVLNPVIEQLVTPQALIDLLEDGWPQQATGNAASALPSEALLNINFTSLRQAWRLFATSESQGFRSVTIPLPLDQPHDKQFRLTMRLRNTTWRLSGIELPAPLREELSKRASVASR
jgi:hypothetical protein